MPELKLISRDGEDRACLFDEADRELIEKYSWSLHSEGYAVSYVGGRIIYMHRLVMGVLDIPDVEVDHKFGSRLDNRKEMLRVCNHSQNMRNARKFKPTAHSKYKGIYLDEGRWHVQISQNRKVKNLGRFSISNEILAAKRYDQVALEIAGDFAHINFQSSKEAQQLKFPWI